MNELTQILTAHTEKYPRMLPQDAVKLIYQNEFGGGHLITDTESSLTRLRAEYAGVEHDPDMPLLENIGGGMVRVMLAALDTEKYPLEALNGGFARSAELHTGSLGGFLQKLDVLKDLTHQGRLSFSPEGLDAYLAGYMAAGCPPVSHSQPYYGAYHPAYRVLHRSCLPAVPVIQHAICQCPTPKSRPLLVAIDGRCASGKTTLAAALQKNGGCEVVHMDDFFLRPEQRTKARYETPGENVDHERFLAEVLLPLYRGESAIYRPFDCLTQQLTDPVRLEPAPVVVAEGVYSCHPRLWPYYDLRIFLTIAPGKQMQRIINREGPIDAEVFRTKWIPLEEQYFSMYQPEHKCSFCLET